MNLHEYQAKELLSLNGVPTQRGKMVSNIKDVDTAANQLKNDTSTDFFVVKAQIHAGGRGKGGGRGGSRRAGALRCTGTRTREPRTSPAEWSHTASWAMLMTATFSKPSRMASSVRE